MQFSVILPVYNVEKYLAACVDSILAQTFTDFEVILVDDGTKDSSGKICDEYAARDERVKVIHKENGGQASARNAGFDAASGECVVFIDSDDFLVSDSFLQDLFDKFKESGADIVLYKHAKYFDALTACTYSFAFADGIDDNDELLLELVKRDAYYGMAWSKSFKRRIATENNVKFDTSLSCEDMDWYFALVSSSEKMAAIDKTYIAYRQREGSVTATIKLKNLVDFILTLENWSKRLTTADMSEKKKAALMGAMAKYYANLLITYARLKDRNKKQYRARIKALSHLLDHSLSARPAKMRKVYRLAGFGGVILMLKMYDRIK